MATETASRTAQWHELAQQLRVDSIRSTTQAGSGHPTSSMSAADLAAVLLAGHLRYDFTNPTNPNNDHLILSKGHAAPLLYAVYKAAGAISDEELLTLRKLGSKLEGHPTPALPWVDVATGSLGQGLPIGVGIALAGKKLEHLPYRVWVILGDSEMAEGSVWEAMARASDEKLGNLIAIVDVNRLGQRGPTALQWQTEVYAERAKAFGWNAIVVDGHNLDEIDAAYRQAEQGGDVPTMIIAKTKKGAGASLVEDQDNWHGKALSKDQADAAIGELGGVRHLTVTPPPPPANGVGVSRSTSTLKLPTWEVGKRLATRQAFGDALKALGAARQDVVVIDAEVGNSTFTEIFQEDFPDRFFQTYIAEQQMIATAVGMSVRGFVPFAATFAAFLARAYDFIRMSAISQANIRLCGSHAGVSIGEDGPSQMALEDLAMMRAVGGSTVLYPCDANQTAQLVAAMADRQGIVYMRTTRAATPVVYGPDESFPIGGSKVLKSSASDAVTIVAAGITVPEALAAADELGSAGIRARVIDLYSVKPVDVATLGAAASETKGIVVVEDHWAEGGLGSAVLEGLASTGQPLPKVKLLGVKQLPGSGTPAELLDVSGISARHIVAAAKTITS
ncbi:MAG TPA: transketolase [Chloroflexota bacterium]|nr:transketolase [Chloroflexota bacterium]